MFDQRERKSIVPGAVLGGRVVSFPEFGAFVDLGGGIQGLLHVSEMSWSRGTKPSEIVAAGFLAPGSSTATGADVREYGARPAAAPAACLGSLADQLRNALKDR